MTKTKPTQKQPSVKTVDKLSFSPRLQLGLAVSLFALSAVLVHDRDMTAAEIWVFNFFYNLQAPFTAFFSIITHFGNVYMMLGISILLLVKGYYHMAVRLLFTCSLAYLISGVAKDLVGRGRPNEFITDLVYRDSVVRGSGFPSGHMALATAFFLTISLYLPAKYKWIAPVGIVLVGISRVQLGVHGPMDVVGGFAIGWASVALFKFVDIRLAKSRK